MSLIISSNIMNYVIEKYLNIKNKIKKSITECIISLKIDCV